MILLDAVLNCFKDINLFFINIRSKGEIIAGEVNVVTFFLFSISIFKIVCNSVFLPSEPIHCNTEPFKSISGSILNLTRLEKILDLSKFILRLYCFCSIW